MKYNTKSPGVQFAFYIATACVASILPLSAQRIVEENLACALGTTNANANSSSGQANGLPFENIGGVPAGSGSGLRSTWGSETVIVPGLAYPGIASSLSALQHAGSSWSDGPVNSDTPNNLKFDELRYGTTITSVETTHGVDGDSDNDGILNFVEYALNTNLNGSDGSVGTFTGGLLSFSKRQAAIDNGDVTYVIETSPSLADGSWTPQVTHGPGNTAATIQYALPTDQGRLFGRLKVLVNPYPIPRVFYGTSGSVADSASIQLAANSIPNPISGTTFTLNIPIGATSVEFCYPSSLREVQSVAYIEFFGFDIKEAFTETSVPVSVPNSVSPTNYRCYRFVPVNPYSSTSTYQVTL